MALDHWGAWFLRPPFGGKEPPRKSFWSRLKAWVKAQAAGGKVNG